MSIYICHISQDSNATYLCFKAEPMSIFHLDSVLHNGLGIFRHVTMRAMYNLHLWQTDKSVYSTEDMHICISQRD